MVDYFLKIDSVPGESRDAQHHDEIDVLSFGWGESHTRSPLGTGGGTGKVEMQAFHFTASTSTASPKLMLLCANGKHLRTAVMVARRSAAAVQEFLTLSFTDVTVSSYQVVGTASDAPIDEVSLNFAKVQIDYKPQNADGSLSASVHAGWDITQNKEF